MLVSGRPPRWSRLKCFTVGAVAAQLMRAIADAYRCIQVFIDDDLHVRHRGSNQRWLDLEVPICPSHGVVLVHDAFVLDGKNAIQILPL